MKQINNMDELREFCFGFVVSDSAKFRTIESRYTKYRMDSFAGKPNYNKSMWIEDSGCIEKDKQYVFIDINFDCDFSKCCWEVKNAKMQ